MQLLTVQASDLVACDPENSLGMVNNTGKLHKSSPLELRTNNNIIGGFFGITHFGGGCTLSGTWQDKINNSGG